MEYVVEILKFDHQGRGIGYLDGVITFVSGALPGEKVKIKVIKNSKKFKIGKVIEVIEASKNRLKNDCPYSCGGCHLRHISYEEELNYKENKIKEIFAKYRGFDLDKIKKIIPNQKEKYRNKATFKVMGEVGYFEEKSNKLIPVDNCLILDERINVILKEVKKLNLDGVLEIVIRVGINDSMVVFKTKKNINIEPLKKYTDSIVLNDDVVFGQGYIIDKIGNYEFMILPDAFFQVNTEGAFKLYSKVKEYVKSSNKLLDLYCGTGTIGIFLSDIAKEVVGVEINEESVLSANKNKEINNINNIKFFNMNSNEFNEKGFDTVVVDPPRSGLDNKTIEYLKKLQAKKIVYVSCDPMTLVRDLNLLDNYEVLEVQPVDMFSRTYHIETICLLKKI